MYYYCSEIKFYPDSIKPRVRTLTSLRQPMKLLLTGEPGRSAVLGLPPT